MVLNRIQFLRNNPVVGLCQCVSVDVDRIYGIDEEQDITDLDTFFKDKNSYKNLPDPSKQLFILNMEKISSDLKRAEFKRLRNKEISKTQTNFSKNIPKRSLKLFSSKLPFSNKSPASRTKKNSLKLVTVVKPQTQKSRHYNSNFFYGITQKRESSKKVKERKKGQSHRQHRASEDVFKVSFSKNLYQKIYENGKLIRQENERR